MRILCPLSILMLGCGDPSATGSSSAPVANSVASTPASAAASAEPAFDQAAYCAKVCKRASDCGVEKAASVAVPGRVDEKGAIDQATKDRPFVEKTCVAECTKTPISSENTAIARVADACVAEPSCPAFHKCLMEAHPEDHPH